MFIVKPLVVILFSVLLSLINTEAQVLRIMPLGNSITYDDNTADKTNPRPVGDRISYRYKLYQLIKEAGYEFDFVGSENSGNNYFQNTEYDDNAGFGGINDGQMAYLITSGYNLRSNQYEAPGPYLQYYPADVILLHIGTNDLEATAADVEDILDNIRLYDSDVLILVARIINRQSYSSLTTTFNNNVEAMVNARGDNRIISVNMETGAGINYTMDMADNLHPNQTGYNKMAIKWFETLNNLNSPPVISTIPQQYTIQGSDFAGLSLDNFVTDNEDNDNQIVWTVDLGPDSKFLASIDGNRILKVFLNDNDWYGSDTIFLKAKDSGNGSFRKTDSVSVIFNVIKGNEPPVITSLPNTIINEDEIYSYVISAEDPDHDILIYSAPQKPDWLTFSTSTRALTGRPSNDDIGIFNIVLRVSDGDEFVDQNFELVVNNVNDLPVVISTPVISIHIGELYNYEFMATDIDISDHLTYSFITKPSWLNFTNGGNTATLSGTPTSADLGSNGVILKVSDGYVDILQGFTISISGQTAMDPNTPQYVAFIYPNPTRDIVYFELEQLSDFSMEIYDISGKLQINFESVRTDHFKIDLSGLSNGFYIYKAFINHQPLEGKILKIQ